MLYQSNEGIKTMDAKVIARKIGELKRSGATFQAKVVEVEMAAMRHAEKHGDSTLLTRLIVAMPQGVKVERLVAHIVDHTPYRYDAKLNCLVKPKKTEKVFLIKQAEKVPFYEYGVDKETVTDWDKLYQFDAYLESQEKREDKEVDKFKGDKAKAMARKAILQAALASLAKLDAPVKVAA